MTPNPPIDPILRATNVRFSFGGRSVLEDVSLAIHPGEFVGLIGVNGSGKTTLLRALIGLIPIDSGSIRVGDIPIGSMTRREIAQSIALVQQDSRVEFAFTGREIVAMGRNPYRGRFGSETKVDRVAVNRAIQVTRTEAFAERSILALSGGERQRLHLARALAQDAAVLLLDEPTANLDLAFQFEALDVVRGETRRGKAALTAIHDLTLAARFCDRLLLLADGRIVAEGPPAAVITDKHLDRYFGLQARIQPVDHGGLFIDPGGVSRAFSTHVTETLQ